MLTSPTKCCFSPGFTQGFFFGFRFGYGIAFEEFFLVFDFAFSGDEDASGGVEAGAEDVVKDFGEVAAGEFTDFGELGDCEFVFS